MYTDVEYKDRQYTVVYNVIKMNKMTMQNI